MCQTCLSNPVETTEGQIIVAEQPIEIVDIPPITMTVADARVNNDACDDAGVNNEACADARVNNEASSDITPADLPADDNMLENEEPKNLVEPPPISSNIHGESIDNNNEPSPEVNIANDIDECPQQISVLSEHNTSNGYESNLEFIDNSIHHINKNEQKNYTFFALYCGKDPRKRFQPYIRHEVIPQGSVSV
jgi:hypothetical protein